MAVSLLAGAWLFSRGLDPESFGTLSMIAAALLLGSIAKLEGHPLDPRSTSNILARRG